LFNYTIKENILYGDDRAKDSEILDAAKIANALEFIESSQLEFTYEDSAYVLLEAFEKEKKSLLERMTKEEYEKKIEVL
jgi:ABC-type multidrug transport system fused ATPase/permease subunit